MDEKAAKIGNKFTSKLVIKDKKRFAITIFIILLVILIVILVGVNKRVDLAKVEDYSKLNSKKYSHQLFEEYEKTENKQRFLSDYDYIQNAIGMYIINNSTTDDNSFSDIIKKIKEEIKKDKWDNLGIERPKFWNGKFDITDEGEVTFTFNNKNMEPSWLKDTELNGKIILNK